MTMGTRFRDFVRDWTRKSECIRRVLQSRGCAPVLILGVATAAIALPRIPLDVAFNDTAVLREYLNADARAAPAAPSMFFLKTPERAGDGYRPLADVFRLALLSVHSRGSLFTLLPVVLSGLMLGLAAMLLFLLARDWLRSGPAAAAAALIFTFSLPVITGSWIVLAGIQSFALAMQALGIYAYARAGERRSGKWLALFCLTCFLGSLYREFNGIVPLCVLLDQIWNARRWRPALISSALLFLHALFPAFLIKLFLTGTFTAEPVWSFGLLAGELKQHASSLLDTLRSQAIFSVLLMVPPTGLAFAALGGILLLPRRKDRVASARIPGIFGLVAATGIVFLFLPQRPNDSLFWIPPLVLLVLLTLSAIRINRLLFIWLGLSWPAFLKVYTIEVHLAYVMLPFSILLSALAREAVLRIRQMPPLRLARAFRYGLLGLVAVASIDHVLNLHAAWRTFGLVESAIKDGGVMLQRKVEPRAPVVANFMHLEDMKFFGADHPDSYYTITDPLRRPGHGVRGGKAFAAFLRDHETRGSIYLLDGKVHQPEAKRIYHGHPYALNPPGEVEVVDRLPVTTRYFFADPLKHLVPRGRLSFAGPPDLVNDFGLDPGPFSRRCGIEYILYRLRSIDPSMVDRLKRGEFQSSPARWIDGDHGEYNIFGRTGRFLGVAWRIGPVDVSNIHMNPHYAEWIDNGLCIWGDTVREVEAAIRKAGSRRPSSVTPVEMGCHGYNIFKIDDRYVALAFEAGKVDLWMLHEDGRRHEWRKTGLLLEDGDLGVLRSRCAAAAKGRSR